MQPRGQMKPAHPTLAGSRFNPTAGGELLPLLGFGQANHAAKHYRGTSAGVGDPTQMVTKRKALTEMEETLVGLCGFLMRAKRGNNELSMGYAYGRKVLAEAEEALRGIEMYEHVQRAIEESEVLALAGQFDEGGQLLLDASGLLMEKSGTADVMRRYAKQIKGVRHD